MAHDIPAREPVWWKNCLVPTHVALLRGVNVGGKKLAMADLREAVAGLGHADVSTYIQSGNVVFTTAETDTAALAAGIERAITERTGITSRVVVLSRRDLAEAIVANPYKHEPNPKFVHVIFGTAEPGPELSQRITDAQRQVAGKGSRDTAQLAGRVLFLHTPDGYGRSELGTVLNRLGDGRHGTAWTARNSATVDKLLSLLG